VYTVSQEFKNKYWRRLAIFIYCQSYYSGIDCRLYRIYCKIDKNLYRNGLSTRQIADLYLKDLSKKSILLYIDLVEKNQLCCWRKRDE